jgi:hypothetical protein
MCRSICEGEEPERFANANDYTVDSNARTHGVARVVGWMEAEINHAYAIV